MLTKMKIRNFKRFDEADIDLGKTVIFVGPNNSGKTTALQALALWDIGLRSWNAKREGKSSPEKRPGVTINRRDLIAIPVTASSLLWWGLHVRKTKTNGNEPGTQNIRIAIQVSGINNGKMWDCGLEFDFSNEESFVCRPLRMPEYADSPVNKSKFTGIPPEVPDIKIAYLPPMSGLTAEEPLLQPGRINVLMGQGQTAQVLRNLCYQIYEKDPEGSDWQSMAEQIDKLYGVKLLPPQFIAERGEIIMEYKEHGTKLDLSNSGRGLQQTLLLLAHLYANPGAVLLLDEPDAHLEILRQREILRVITDIADEKGSQIIAATHSEVLLNETATRGTVVAFVGKPHTINDRGSQLLKSLTDIGWDQYYQAEQNGWVLYLESASDLEILRVFAKTLGHEAEQFLARPFVHYIHTNLPGRCRDHFYGLREAKQDLVGVALFDRVEQELQSDDKLCIMMWNKREIENYFSTEEVLLSYARYDLKKDDLFDQMDADRREKAMRSAIDEVVKSLNTLGKPDPWSSDIKASDDFLDPTFKNYFKKLDSPILLRKTNYYTLANLVPKDKLDAEITDKLNQIVTVAKRSHTPE